MNVKYFTVSIDFFVDPVMYRCSAIWCWKFGLQ